MSTYIIAEAGVNHNGSLDNAKKLIDMAKECGADAIKFQTFKSEESTGSFADKAEYQKENDHTDESQLDMLRKLELPFSDFRILRDYCKEKGIDFISTPDGDESLQCLVDLEVPLIKVGSTEVTNLGFLKKIAATGKKIILSTGMSTLGEVEYAINTLKSGGAKEFMLMHCTTDYPTAIEDVNLRAMITLREAFHVPVGLSDHTLSNEAAIAAVALGAFCVEKHVTLDRAMQGPDHKASMPPNEFKQYVQSIRNTENLLGDGIKKPTQREVLMMKQARRSILAERDLSKGTILTEDMLCFKRPGDGIDIKYLPILLGRTLKRDLKRDEKISWQDL